MARGGQPGQHGCRPGAAHHGRARPRPHLRDQPHHRPRRQRQWMSGRTSGARSRRCSRWCPPSIPCGSISPSPRPSTWRTRGPPTPRPASVAARVGARAGCSPTDRCTRRRPGHGRRTGVDAQTGTLPLQATFPNPGGLLRPGQFGRVRLVTTRKNAIDPPAGGAGAPGDLQRLRRGLRQRRPDPRHQAREPGGQRLGRVRGPRARRPDRGRGPAEGARRVKVRPTASKAPAPDSAAGA